MQLSIIIKKTSLHLSYIKRIKLNHLIACSTPWVYGVCIMPLAVYFLVSAEVYHVYQKLVTGCARKTAGVPSRSRSKMISSDTKPTCINVLYTAMTSLKTIA